MITTGFIGDTETTIVAGTSGNLIAVGSWFFKNSDIETRTVTLYRYSTGSTAEDETAFLTFDVPTSDTWDMFSESSSKHFLEEGDIITAVCDVANKVSFNVNYVKKVV